MTSAWSNPHHQQDRIPSMSDGSGPAGQQQTSTQQDTDNVVQSCSCSWVLKAQIRPSSSHVNHRLPEPMVSYQSSCPECESVPGIDNPTGIATITNGQMMIRPVGRQAPWNQGNDQYAPRYEAVGFLQAHASAAPNQDQMTCRSWTVFGVLLNAISTTQSRSLTRSFEYGPSGRPQVVIMLE
ncbi:hypothetical protein BGY98DRAFT_39639 [Russula aff. rugulosa BPL654]|nr:hypothetical protein BGY98DRAFT_39639 [Russula aff. rugulosa BPL654]